MMFGLGDVPEQDFADGFRINIVNIDDNVRHEYFARFDQNFRREFIMGYEERFEREEREEHLVDHYAAIVHFMVNGPRRSRRVYYQGGRRDYYENRRDDVAENYRHSC